jgi:hypothetical protein
MNRVVVLLLAFLASCFSGPDIEDKVQAGGVPPAVTTSAATYTTGQAINVSWSNLTTNTNDWIALAPVSSDLSTVSAWVYTNGQANGSFAFPGLANGEYVARAFLDDGYELIDESDPFTVASPSAGNVTTDLPSYAVSQPIQVSWTGLPGNQNDWIAIATAGSPDTSVIAYVYTAGQAAGNTTFAGLSTAGNYVVRVFANDTYEKLGEAAFTVTGGTFGSVSTDKANYSFDDNVVVTWSGLPGNANDWIAIAPQGSSATTVTRWVYTAGVANGSFAFEAPSTGGTYVARAFVNDSYEIVGESAAFGVGLSVSTSKTSYTTAEAVVVSWENLPTNQFDWVAIAPAGSSLSTVTTWVYTNGVSTGQNTFGMLAAGSYVARAFLDNSYTLLDETTPFTVAPGGGTVTVSTDAAMYTAGQDITVTWSGLPGNANDWIALAPDGSADSNAILWVYTGGQAAGSTTFVGGLSAPGAYVARAFEDDSYAKLGQSSAFNVQ